MAHRMCAVRRVYVDVHLANTPYAKKKLFLCDSLPEGE
jgi:hypothetical protein